MILLKLIVSHLLADFVLQPRSWVADRMQKKHRSKYLYFHGFISGLLAYLLAGSWSEWWVFPAVAFTHIAIDIWKAHQPEGLVPFIIDQALHLAVLLAVWQAISGNGKLLQFLKELLDNPQFWTYSVGYLLVIWPVGYVVAYATRNWKNEIRDEGLYEAGKRIGQLERVLILTFVLLGRYEAIGFLIAAKSVFRFSQIQEHKDRKVGEYILIGTMLSFAISIFTGLVIEWLNLRLV